MTNCGGSAWQGTCTDTRGVYEPARATGGRPARRLRRPSNGSQPSRVCTTALGSVTADSAEVAHSSDNVIRLTSSRAKNNAPQPSRTAPSSSQLDHTAAPTGCSHRLTNAYTPAATTATSAAPSAAATCPGTS